MYPRIIELPSYVKYFCNVVSAYPSNMKHMDLNSTSLSDLEIGEDLEKFGMILTIIKVLFVTFGGILQLMIIHFERFGRDAAKSSLVNRLTGSLMEWLLCLSCSGLITDLVYAISSDISYHFGIALGLPRRICIIGGLLTINEALLVRYIIKVCLKRIPVIDDDLLCLVLKTINVVMSTLFALVQAHLTPYQLNPYRLWMIHKNQVDEEIQFPIALILVAFNFLETLMIGIHLSVQKCVKKSNDNNPVIQINLKPIDQTNLNPIVINNQDYNLDILDFSAYFTFVTFFTAFSLPFPVHFIKQLIPTLTQMAKKPDNYVLYLILGLRELSQTILVSFVFPLILIICSSELTSFFGKTFQSLLSRCPTIIVAKMTKNVKATDDSQEISINVIS